MELSETDEPARYIALQTAQWFFDAAGTVPATPDDLIATAAAFEHYLTNGQTVAFDCADSARKFIR